MWITVIVRSTPLPVLLVWSVLITASPGRSESESSGSELAPEPADSFESSIRPVLVAACSDCHDTEESQGKAAFLSAQSAADVAIARHLWKSVAEQLLNRTMPPPEEPQPSESDRLRVANWVDQVLQQTACNHGEAAAPVTTRRLNRVEYDNTLRDLLGVDAEFSRIFPVDGSGGEGFDNNGETLFLPTVLLERYLEAARAAVDLAVMTPPLRRSFTAADLLPPHADRNAMPCVIAAGKQVETLITVCQPADYALQVVASPQSDSPVRAVVKIDDLAVERLQIEPSTDPEQISSQTIHLRLSRGVHAVALRCPGDAGVMLHGLSIEETRPGPTDEQRANHVRLIGLAPGEQPNDPEQAVREILARFARRAYRHPVEDDEVSRLLLLYRRAAERGDPFEDSVKLAMQAVLVSPRFLFRIEATPTSPAPEPIDDHELAVRLSYFLWGTMPDEELSRLADHGRLSDTGVLVEQVDRLLDDARSATFAEEFVGQWLGTRDVGARGTRHGRLQGSVHNRAAAGLP